MFASLLCLCCGGEKKQKMRRKKKKKSDFICTNSRRNGFFFEKCIFASAEAHLKSVLWFMMRVFEVLIIKFRGDATRVARRSVERIGWSLRAKFSFRLRTHFMLCPWLLRSLSRTRPLSVQLTSRENAFLGEIRGSWVAGVGVFREFLMVFA